MNSFGRMTICSLFSVLPSPSDWPSTAPNPSLSMQLWVSRRSRTWQTMCRLSAPVGYCIITHTDDSWPTHSTTEIRHPRVPKLQREPVFITWKDTKIFYATSAQLASENLFDILQLLQRSQNKTYPDIKNYFCNRPPVSHCANSTPPCRITHSYSKFP